MTGIPRDLVHTEIYAQTSGWALVVLREPNREPTVRVVGYIARHDRLADDVGEPYIGSPLTHVDVERRLVRNLRGKVIALVGEPLPLGRLLEDLYGMMRRAETEWNIEDGATWERLEPGSPAVLQ